MLLNKIELAEKLNVSVSTLDKLIKMGIPRIKLKGCRPGYIYEDCVAWLRENNIEANND